MGKVAEYYLRHWEKSSVLEHMPFCMRQTGFLVPMYGDSFLNLQISYGHLVFQTTVWNRLFPRSNGE